jgi:ankyrin repeat protein
VYNERNDFLLFNHVEFLNQAKYEILQDVLDYLHAHGVLEPQVKMDMLNRADSHGIPLLHRAVEQGAAGCVALLLREGADIAQRSASNESVLDVLFRSRRERMNEIKDILYYSVAAKVPTDKFGTYLNIVGRKFLDVPCPISVRPIPGLSVP